MYMTDMEVHIYYERITILVLQFRSSVFHGGSDICYLSQDVPSTKKNLFLESRLSVCVCVYGCVLGSVCTLGRILFVSGIQEFVCRRWVWVKYKHSRSKNRDHSNSSPPPKKKKHKMVIFSIFPKPVLLVGWIIWLFGLQKLRRYTEQKLISCPR